MECAFITTSGEQKRGVDRKQSERKKGRVSANRHFRIVCDLGKDQNRGEHPYEVQSP